jgi:hypothetical protein
MIADAEDGVTSGPSHANAVEVVEVASNRLCLDDNSAAACVAPSDCRVVRR